MEPKITRLVRESNPPAGMLASPTPQVYDLATNQPGTVVGYNGAPASVLVDLLGNPISSANRLPVADQAAVDKLEQVRGLLADLESNGATAANQTAIADVLGTRATEATLTGAVDKLTALVDRLDQTLQVQFPSPQEVTLTGQLPPSSMELYGNALDERPSADSVPMGAAWVLLSTLDVWMSDGEDWLEVS